MCIQEASLVPPVDGAGSWFSVVTAHLCRIPDPPHLHHVAHQPHQFLGGNQDSYLSCRLWKLGGSECYGSILIFLALVHAVLLRLPLFNFEYFPLQCAAGFSVFSDRVRFSAHLLDIKAFFYLASCVTFGSWSPTPNMYVCSKVLVLTFQMTSSGSIYLSKCKHHLFTFQFKSLLFNI